MTSPKKLLSQRMPEEIARNILIAFLDCSPTCATNRDELDKIADAIRAERARLEHEYQTKLIDFNLGNKALEKLAYERGVSGERARKSEPSKSFEDAFSKLFDGIRNSRVKEESQKLWNQATEAERARIIEAFPSWKRIYKEIFPQAFERWDGNLPDKRKPITADDSDLAYSVYKIIRDRIGVDKGAKETENV